MGVSFSYFTVQDVDTDIKNTILAEAKTLNKREWSTTEGFIFFEHEGYENKLFGDSKVFPEYENIEEVKDATFILNGLKKWSSDCNIDWQIVAEEAEVGFIKNGECDNAVKDLELFLTNPEAFLDSFDPEA